MRALVRLARLLERADAGLTLAQFRILELISRGTERSTHIANRLATSKPAVTAVVEGLVSAGLIARGGVAGDRRVIRLELTEAGREALAHAEQVYRARLQPVIDEISDPDALVRLLAEVDDVMDARWEARVAGASRAACRARQADGPSASDTGDASAATARAKGQPVEVAQI
ncbi:MAG TPA: MarR family transcriptional regulator [Actinopolymorphaceae bacterium]